MNVLLAILLLIPSAQTTVAPDRIRRAVEQYVSSRWDAKQGEYLLEFRSIPSGIQVGTGAYTVRVAIDGIPRLKGFTAFPLEIVCDGKTVQRTVVRAHVRTFGNVLVADRQLARHEQSLTGSISQQRLETTDLPDDVLGSDGEVSGKRTTRMIAARTVLCRSMLERIPVVKPEDEVIVSVRSGKATVSVLGIVKQEGSVGDVVTVQRLGSKDRLTAIVVDAKRVVVELDRGMLAGWKSEDWKDQQ